MADADEQTGTEGQEPVTERTIEIIVAEIPENLQQKAKRRVCLAMDKYDIEKDIATDVKKHFDEECEGSWHCVEVAAGFTFPGATAPREQGNAPSTRAFFGDLY